MLMFLCALSYFPLSLARARLKDVVIFLPWMYTSSRTSKIFKWIVGFSTYMRDDVCSAYNKMFHIGGRMWMNNENMANCEGGKCNFLHSTACTYNFTCTQRKWHTLGILIFIYAGGTKVENKADKSKYEIYVQLTVVYLQFSSSKCWWHGYECVHEKCMSNFTPHQ